MVRRNVSLANQIVSEILSQIDSGEILVGGKELPSETELSQRYNVSRATIREALVKLELGGVIVRRHGVGTYISPVVAGHRGSVRNWFDKTPNFMSFIQREGYQAECILINIGIVSADSVAVPLEITPQTQTISIQRVYLVNSSPVIHSSTFVPLELVEPGYRETVCSSFRCEDSIYDLLHRWCNREIHDMKSEICAVSSDEKMASLLDCSPGDSLLRVDQVGYGVKMTPLFYSRNHFKADQVSIVEMGNLSNRLRIGVSDESEDAQKRRE